MHKYFIVFVLMAITGISIGQSEKKHQKYFTALEKNQTKKANKILKKINDEYRNRYFENMKKAEKLAEKNLIDSAFEYYHFADKLRSDGIVSLGGGTYYEQHLELTKKAIPCFDKLVAANPDSTKYLYLRAAFNIQLSNFEASLVDLTALLHLEPNEYNYYNRGVVYGRMGRRQEALQDYVKATEINDKYELGWMNRGFSNLELKNYQEAIENLDVAIKLVTDLKGRSFIINNQGYAYLMLGKYVKARELITESIRINSLNPYAFRNLALLDIKTLQYEEACKNIEKSLELGFTETYGNEVLELKERWCK
jgi:tetratricopeptide (TPR) repeat protein